MNIAFTKPKGLVVALFQCLCVVVLLTLTVFHSEITRAQQSSPVPAHDARWATIKTSLFGDKDIIQEDSIVTIDVPPRAIDAAVVPVVIESKIPQNPERYISKIHLVVDQNPVPLAGIFEFSEKGNSWASIETRLRINEFTHIRAIAELNDGSMYMDSSFIKASGGCSAPSVGDLDAAIARAGKMRLQLRRTDLAGSGDTAEALLKISHPNNSGMQFDQMTQQYVPAYFIHTIGAQLGDEDVIKVTTNFSMSENPTVRFKFKPGVKDEKLKVYAVDSDSKRFEHEVPIRAGG